MYAYIYICMYMYKYVHVYVYVYVCVYRSGSTRNALNFYAKSTRRCAGVVKGWILGSPMGLGGASGVPWGLSMASDHSGLSWRGSRGSLGCPGHSPGALWKLWFFEYFVDISDTFALWNHVEIMKSILQKVDFSLTSQIILTCSSSPKKSDCSLEPLERFLNGSFCDRSHVIVTFRLLELV